MLYQLSEMVVGGDALESFKVSAPKLLENYVQVNTKIREYSSKLKAIEESTKNMTINDEEFEQIKKEISDLQDKIDSLTEEREDLKSSLAKIMEQVESADREIVAIKKTLQELFKINENKEIRMDTDVQKLKTQYHKQQQAIESLNTKVDSFSLQQPQISEGVANNQRQIKTQTEEIQVIREDLTTTKQELVVVKEEMDRIKKSKRLQNEQSHKPSKRPSLSSLKSASPSAEEEEEEDPTFSRSFPNSFSKPQRLPKLSSQLSKRPSTGLSISDLRNDYRHRKMSESLHVQRLQTIETSFGEEKNPQRLPHIYRGSSSVESYSFKESQQN